MKREVWTLSDAARMYRMDTWSGGFFEIDADGGIAVRPDPDAEGGIALNPLLADLARRGLRFPALLRFQDILRTRVRVINEAFGQAIEEAGYGNRYRCVYPIKVNQLHEVVEEVLDAGEAWGLGLECGSKAELVAALAHLTDDARLLICNGYKDRDMMVLMHDAQCLGKNLLPVIEKYNEFEAWMGLTAESPGESQFGARIQLSVNGSGRWGASSGEQSKFGITIPELMDVVATLEAEGRGADFRLLHFHLGSQLDDVDVLREAVREVTQIYAQLVQRGFDLRYIDVGGGMGVRYDASDVEDGGIRYSLHEYANTIVATVAEVCNAAGIRHPELISESGRGITAHHSLLVVQVLNVGSKPGVQPDFEPAAGSDPMVGRLYDAWRELADTVPGPETAPSAIETYHLARDQRRNADQKLRMGYLDLESKSVLERLYWATLTQVARHLGAMAEESPPELQEVEELLVENYLCNFSVFQSMLDHWAIEQSFPIMPLSRLNERPDRRARLVDLTCDSDGKVSYYVTGDDDRSFIYLHPLQNGTPYYLGVFLMGAYQDIMGDSHNLFGRVPEVHIYFDREEDGCYWIEKIIPGTTVHEMLEQVQYFQNDLKRRMNTLVRQKIEAAEIRPSMGMRILEEYNRVFDCGTYGESD